MMTQTIKSSLALRAKAGLTIMNGRDGRWKTYVGVIDMRGLGGPGSNYRAIL